MPASSRSEFSPLAGSAPVSLGGMRRKLKADVASCVWKRGFHIFQIPGYEYRSKPFSKRNLTDLKPAEKSAG